MESRHTQRLLIKNPHSHALTLIIEPWADELVMPAGAIYEVVGEGPGDNCFEVLAEGMNFFVFGWPGSTATVFCDGQLLRDFHVPAPPLPKARSGEIVS